MKSTSKEYKKRILKQREFFYSADIDFKDGSSIRLNDKDDLMNDGICVKSGTSGTDSFDIGAAIIGELVLTLNNSDGKFDKYDFLDAEINLQVGLKFESSIEYIPMGKYIVDEAETPGITVVLSALDYMTRFERKYSEVRTIYPATLNQIVRDTCVCCDVGFPPGHFDNDDFLILTRPEGEELSCMAVISYAAQVAGCYAKMDEYGQLVFRWYDTEIFESHVHMDGGNLRDYTSGNWADGGDFINYAGVTIDGGSFADMDMYAHIYQIGSLNIATDEIIITGIRVKGQEGNEEENNEEINDENEGYLFGEEGYVLSIEENPFILTGNQKFIAETIGRKIVGMAIRTFSVNALSDPSIEAGDCAYISDRKGQSYPVYITNTTFKLGDYQEFSCGAESPGKNRAHGISAGTRAIIAERKEISRQLSAYDVAVQQMTNLITNSFGVFKSEEKKEDGSTIYYLHNKPEISTSSTIWKMTANAFAVSMDGGRTWNAGIDSSGNAVFNVLNAIGINANWINAGSLLIGGTQINENGQIAVYDVNGNLLFAVNKEKIVINTKNLKVDEVGNVTISGKLEGLNAIHLKSESHNGESFPVIQYDFIPENEKIVFKNSLGDIMFQFTEQPDNNLFFPMHTRFANIDIDSAAITDLRTSTTDIHVTIDEESYINATVIRSGEFVTLYGSFSTGRLAAGSYVSGSLSEIPKPRHKEVTCMGRVGAIPILFRLNTSGTLSMRNIGASDITTEPSVSFRFDYFLF